MKYWMIIIVFLLGTACSDLNSVPQQYLQPAKMQDVLWDMMLADRFIEQYVKYKGLDVEQERFTRYAEVFSIHQIDYEQFKASMDYYVSRPDQLKTIYVELNKKREAARIQREQEQQKLEEAQLKEQDSLLNLQNDTLKTGKDSSFIEQADSLLNNNDSAKLKNTQTDTVKKIINSLKDSVDKIRPASPPLSQ